VVVFAVVLVPRTNQPVGVRDVDSLRTTAR